MTNNQAPMDKFAQLRQRVEEVVRGHTVHRPAPPAGEIQQILHELQLLQLEYEIQQEKMEQTQQQLDEARNKYSDLYDFAPVGYFTVGENGLILEANLTGANLVEVSRDDLINRPFFRFVARDSQDEFYVHRQQLFETKTRQVCELKLVKEDGRPFYARLDSIVVPDDEGDFGQFQTTVLDITERRQAQERLRHQEKMAAVGQLAAGIAHDFNNILQTIISFAELPVDGDRKLPPQVSEGLEQINLQGQAAARLVRQLLDFSRRSMSEHHPVALVPFMEELVALLERTIPENIRLELKSGPDQYWIKSDAVQLEQALLNLVVNARDAMPDGGTLQLSLSRRRLAQQEPPPAPEMRPGEWIAISVSDTGAGIPLHLLNHIFEPFFTTKTAGQGAGLGLAQVYGMVRRHQGDVKVTSRPGQGTTFTLYLPALAMPAEILPEPKSSQSPQGRGETLLLVEDEPAVLDAVQFTLKHLGYRVLTAGNGRQALELYDTFPGEIALILTDLTMPEMSGLALAQALWQREPALKVVALTGYLETEAGHLLAAGFVDYVEKPLRIRQLAETINRCLEQG